MWHVVFATNLTCSRYAACVRVGLGEATECAPFGALETCLQSLAKRPLTTAAFFNKAEGLETKR